MLSSQYFGPLSVVFGFLFIGWLTSFALKWRRHRAQYAHLPCPPHDFWWGHLKIIGMAQKEMPPGCKSVAATNEWMWPKALLVDTRHKSTDMIQITTTH
jgi:hypothetical protein